MRGKKSPQRGQKLYLKYFSGDATTLQCSADLELTKWGQQKPAFTDHFLTLMSEAIKHRCTDLWLDPDQFINVLTTHLLWTVDFNIPRGFSSFHPRQSLVHTFNSIQLLSYYLIPNIVVPYFSFFGVCVYSALSIRSCIIAMQLCKHTGIIQFRNCICIPIAHFMKC